MDHPMLINPDDFPYLLVRSRTTATTLRVTFVLACSRWLHLHLAVVLVQL